MPVECNVTRITELDDQLAQLRQFWKGTTDFWVFLQSSNLTLNHLGSSLSDQRAFLD